MTESDCRAKYISHSDTRFFSRLIEDFLNDDAPLLHFLDYTPNDAGLTIAINNRKNYPVNRTTLHQTISEQYTTLTIPENVQKNIEALKEEKTFTITSAHQPNLLTGYAYFFYKIIHSIKLAQHLSRLYPENKFVPVFYIGSEDNDLDELGVFRFQEKTYRWQTEQTGAVGRMFTNDLQPLLKDFFAALGTHSEETKKLKQIIEQAYQPKHKIADAIRYIINEFLGKYGIIVLDADDKNFKKSFAPILLQELLAPQSDSLIQKTSEALNKTYKAQAFSRPINLFYLKDNIRERIEYNAGIWSVKNTEITFDKEGITQEVREFPERFSPNVILRGLYQESILPNVAFIGGGSEVAYWMQLKDVFKHYNVFFPAVILRQSVHFLNKNTVAHIHKMGIALKEIFIPKDEWANKEIDKIFGNEISLEHEEQQLIALLQNIKDKVVNIDKTLANSTEAVMVKINKQLEILRKKIIRAKKRNIENRISELETIKQHAFPYGKLQERYETFMPQYLQYGDKYFDILLQHTLPYGNQFLVIEE